MSYYGPACEHNRTGHCGRVSCPNYVEACEHCRTPAGLRLITVPEGHCLPCARGKHAGCWAGRAGHACLCANAGHNPTPDTEGGS